MVVSVGLELGQALGLTRIDFPLMLGTRSVEDRDRRERPARPALRATDVLFSLVYAAIFAAVGRAGWLFGLALGAVHAAFAGGPLLN